MRCVKVLKNGKGRCKRMTKNGQRCCWQHEKSGCKQHAKAHSRIEQRGGGGVRLPSEDSSVWTIYALEGCGYAMNAENALKGENVVMVKFQDMSEFKDLFNRAPFNSDDVKQCHPDKTSPLIFKGTKCIGGSDDLR